MSMVPTLPPSIPAGSDWLLATPNAVPPSLRKDAKFKTLVRPAQNEWSNANSFVSEGYLARCIRQTCASCGSVSEHSEGIFHVERSPSGARRLQALLRGVQWTLADNLPMEVTEQSVEWCVACLRTLGFSREVQAAGRTLVIPQAVQTPGATQP